MPALSIIIVNYNAESFLKQCLASIYEREHSFSFETIVVDNHSVDGSAAMVRKDFPQVSLLENSCNIGFAKGNNAGIAASTGRYILLLNSDTKILDAALEKLTNFLDTHREVAVVAPRLVYPDLMDQGVARTFPTPINVLFGRTTLLTRIFPNNRYSKKYLLSRGHSSDEPFEVDWVSGACLMMRKEIIEAIGDLDEKYFMYWEDVDLCFRIKKAGWKICCIPEARVIHYEGKSTSKKVSNRCIIEFNKGAYRYYRKYHIKSPFEIMNIVSIFGLTLRMGFLIGMNIIDTIKAKVFGRDISEHPAN